MPNSGLPIFSYDHYHRERDGLSDFPLIFSIAIHVMLNKLHVRNMFISKFGCENDRVLINKYLKANNSLAWILWSGFVNAEVGEMIFEKSPIIKAKNALIGAKKENPCATTH